MAPFSAFGHRPVDEGSAVSRDGAPGKRGWPLASRTGHGWVALGLAAVGAFVGNTAGSALGGSLPALARSAPVGFGPVPLSLFDVAHLTLGASVNLNLLGALGAVAGLLVARRL
jgi:hypothetical protein